MTGTDSRELLTAARTTKAQTGPGTLADYPVPGGDAHLLIHYAPGSRAYRFKLTAPGGNQVPPGTNQEPGTVPGNHPGPDGPAGDQDGSAPAPGGQRRPTGRHSRDRPRSRSLSGTTSPPTHTTGLPGCWTATSPATPWSACFPCQTRLAGRRLEVIAEEAFAICNGHPRDAAGQELSRRYYQRQLRALSFPGISPCCSRSCFLRYRPVSQVVVEAAGRADVL